eukprot:5152857-Prymnesium_polylepis.1
MFAVEGGARLRLEGITLANGGGVDKGGAMEINNGTVALVGSAVVDSRASVEGGAVLIRAGSLTIAEDS